MDHHDVLGVRPHASKEEIELAYRGRRTQYHPDKYANADAETLRWATAKMQEVNEAYAALSGTAPSGASGPATPGGRPSPPSPEPILSLPELLQQVVDLPWSSRITFAPNIPYNKLHSALGSYGQGLAPKDVLVLIDSTLMGGAKEGIIVATDGIRTKELMEQPQRWLWGAIRQVDIKGSNLRINGDKVADCGMAEPEQLQRLFALVQHYVQLLQQAGQGGKGGSGPSPSFVTPAERAEVFEAARARLLDLCEAIAPMEQQTGRTLIDRHNAASHFGVLEDCLHDSDPRMQDIGLSELLDIEALCRNMLLYAGTEGHEVPQSLHQAGEDDSPLVQELRSLLNLMVTGRERQQQTQTERFFRR